MAAAFDLVKVYLRFSIDGQMQYVPTGESVPSAIWDQKEGKVKIPPRLSKAEVLAPLWV